MFSMELVLFVFLPLLIPCCSVWAVTSQPERILSPRLSPLIESLPRGSARTHHVDMHVH